MADRAGAQRTVEIPGASQAEPVDKLEVDERWITVPADVGEVRVRTVLSPDAKGTLPAILYMHGGGWVLGNAHTHDRLIREFAVGTGAAVVFVELRPLPGSPLPRRVRAGLCDGTVDRPRGRRQPTQPRPHRCCGRLGRRRHDCHPRAHDERSRRRPVRAAIAIAAAVVLIVLYTGGGGGYWFVDWCGGRPAPATPASARAWAFYSVLWISERRAAGRIGLTARTHRSVVSEAGVRAAGA